MFHGVSSNIMRTTLDIASPVLEEVKAIHKQEDRSMGAIVSELLAEALARRKASRRRAPFRWTARPMRARIDLEDKDAVYAVLDDGRK
jgi:hypothetical protein